MRGESLSEGTIFNVSLDTLEDFDNFFQAHLYFPMEEDEPEDLIDDSDSGIAMRRSSFSDYDHDQEIRQGTP